MKVSLNWVREYAEIKLPPEELKERISVSLTEAQGIEDFGKIYEGIVVAEVTDVTPHPESNKLLVLTLNIGKEKKVKTIVQTCPVKAGDKVAYLKPGLVVPETAQDGSPGEKVKKTEIKGVKSDGFVPSGREIGLNYDHTTVYTVDPKLKPGAAFEQALDLVDPILEIKNKALTNRPDAFSIVGMAREIAAIQGTKFKAPEWLVDPSTIKPSEDVENTYPIKIVNNAKALCSRYMAVVIDNVKVEPSPTWMQIRLAKMGVRPVNNVVDISNYLMLEAGQPNHAFDYDKIVEKDRNFKGTAVITIRLADSGEKLTTIEGQQHEFEDDTIVIADSENPLGIAGVMGGKDTEVTENTKRVIFQVENLNMYSIRRTSWKLGIFSEAVTRFSKGLDANLCEPVMYKGIQMIKELAGGMQASKLQDYYPEPVKSKYISISEEEVRSRTGVDFNEKDIKEILQRLDLKVEKKPNSKSLTVEIPTFRRDLNIPEDINEELVRIYGYDRVERTLPTRSIAAVTANRSHANKMRIKNILKMLGANEFYNYSFVGRSLYDILGLSLKECRKLKNPLSQDLAYMRPLVAPSLVEKIPQNLRIREEIACFEIDKVHVPKNIEEKDPDGLPIEEWDLALVHTVSYYHAKLYLEKLLSLLYISDFEIISTAKVSAKKIPGWIEYAKDMYHPSRTALVFVGGKAMGLVGQIDVDTAADLDLPSELSAFEIRTADLNDFIKEVPDYKDPSSYPSVIHDFCIITDKDVPYQAIENTVVESDQRNGLIRDLVCKDIYREEGSLEKKTTIQVEMQSNDKTLTEKEITQVRDRIVKSIKKRVAGRLDE